VSGFRNFLMRGNLIDLAVAVVVGVAFNAVVQALVSSLITPLIAAMSGGHQKSFASLSFILNGSKFTYGVFINAIISFLVIAAVVYYLVVAPATRLTAIAQRNKAASDRQCPECLSQIPIAAKRCMYCTSQVTPVEPTTTPAPAPVLRRRHRHGSLASD
jgi:large conductance mechanosensitive channel